MQLCTRFFFFSLSFTATRQVFLLAHVVKATSEYERKFCFREKFNQKTNQFDVACLVYIANNPKKKQIYVICLCPQKRTTPSLWKVVVYQLSFNICFSVITQSMMRESKEEKKKASMIKLRILRCVKIKMFFFLY